MRAAPSRPTKASSSIAKSRPNPHDTCQRSSLRGDGSREGPPHLGSQEVPPGQNPRENLKTRDRPRELNAAHNTAHTLPLCCLDVLRRVHYSPTYRRAALTPRNALRDAAAGLKTFLTPRARSLSKRSVRHAARVVAAPAPVHEQR